MKPEHQPPPLGRNPNQVERWKTVNQGQSQPPNQVNARQTATSRPTGVWHSSRDHEALKTGVWNPSRQNEAAPAGNRWVLLGIVMVCSLSSFAIFQSLFRPSFSNRVVSARVNPASRTAPRALPPAVKVQSEADQVAASAVTFDQQALTGTTKPVESTGSSKPVDGTRSSKPVDGTGSSTLVEIPRLTNTLPVNQIKLEQIDSIAASGGQPVLRFKDGSSLNVDAFTLQQLPSDVRLRITYARGRDGP
jgi:hypothetical protein